MVFATWAGTPMDPDDFSHTFSNLTRKAGPGHWHPHELRHSGASLMLAQGTSQHVVSEILRHVRTVITKGIYGHLLVDDKGAAAETMSQTLIGSPWRAWLPTCSHRTQKPPCW